MNSENKKIDSIIKRCINLINHVHISEPYLRLIQNKKFFEKLMSTLNKYNYEKWISIEMRSQKKNNYDNIVKTIKLVNSYL